MQNCTIITGTILFDFDLFSKKRLLKYHFSRVYELIEKSSEIRPIYMKCLRTTSIHGEVDSESVLMNILLRNFMHNNLLDQGMNLATSILDI